MRISIEETDKGFSEVARLFGVRLNGTVCSHVITADSEEGFVARYTGADVGGVKQAEKLEGAVDIFLFRPVRAGDIERLRFETTIHAKLTRGGFLLHQRCLEFPPLIISKWRPRGGERIERTVWFGEDEIGGTHEQIAEYLNRRYADGRAIR